LEEQATTIIIAQNKWWFVPTGPDGLLIESKMELHKPCSSFFYFEFTV